ncbi:MAG: HD domain-containing protein [Acidobacteriota bacterium]
MTENTEATSALIVDLAQAASTNGLYPADHPRSRRALDSLTASLAAAFDERQKEDITFLLVDDDLAVDQQPWQRSAHHRTGLVKAMTRSGIERLTIARAVGEGELARLLRAIGGARIPNSTEHVTIGRLAIEEGEGEELEGLGRTLEGRLDDLEQSLGTLLEDPTRGFAQLERSLWQVLDSTTRENRTFALLKSLRGKQDRLWRHAVNVGLLVTHHARSLNIEGQALHDLGVGALLHDIGYLDLMVGEGKADLPANLRRRHPELGAMRLAAVPGMCDLAILVAYEHHLAWNGQGGYPQSAGRRPGFAAQITAVSDTWEMLLDGAAAVPATQRYELAAGELKRRAGTMLDPFLVATFLELMKTAPGAQTA